MHQRSADLSTPLLGDEGRASSSFGSSSIDDERTTAVRTRRSRGFDCSPKSKIRYLALYLLLSFFLVYDGSANGNFIEMLTESSGTAFGFSLISLVIFLVMVLPEREWNRPVGTCFHPGTNLSSINATIENSNDDEEMQQTPSHVLRKVVCDTCGSSYPRFKVLVFLISISVLWGALFISLVYEITCILNPSGETRYMLRHSLRQLLPLDD